LAIKNLQESRKIPIYGDGTNIREWIHVKDHCRGIQAVIQKGEPGEIYNIGSGTRLSNLEIARLLAENFDTTLEKSIVYVKDRPGHDLRYSLNSEKILKIWNSRSEICIKSNLASLCNDVRSK
jgi:dTDP-glucose 4,6-dehydratase